MGGYKIHLLASGENKIGPTVVFFHGAGDIALHWNLVLPKVGKFAKAVAIDHAGEGWSDHGHGMALNQQVYDTYKALKKGGFNAPYIVVGHSLGGITANLFAAKYSKEVIGVVMVDATHPDVVLKVYNKETKKMEWMRMRLKADQPIKEVVTTPLSEPKETKSFQARRDFGDMLNKFSDEDKARFNWIYNERKWTYVKGQSNTYESEIMQDMHTNKEKYNLGDIPLVVISGGDKDTSKGDGNWSSERLAEHSKNLQKDLLSLSTNSKQIIAKKSGHNVHIDEPKLIVKIIKKMIRSYKVK
ncbi:alpha/beta hydrolase [Pontimicrobium aquaticum]|uniref:Alpha/beta hydrolase n=1 Tax=Pontimicrobium aquaticum TaxID=2565367 RepID=A0A4U0F0A9_9FLAO|nr:alpha/beta hydrolase [Pontimicrobium aquaticum]TJY37797.1 alpha/beta hydrolase [Pontimicrobium aquaticum]